MILKNPKSLLAFTLIISVVAVFTQRAEAAIYVKIDGIVGDATHFEHQKWMTAESAGEDISRVIGINRKGRREVSEPILSDFQFAKQMDISSPFLRQLAVSDGPGREVIIHFVSTGSPGATYFEIKLSDALISSVSSASSGDRPIEVITLNFTRIEWTYTPLEANNEGPGSPVTTGYDVLSNSWF